MSLNAGSPVVCTLACNLIEEHLGPTCEAVCGTLLRKGRSSLQEIAWACKLLPIQVRQALLVLMQHNCVVVHVLGPISDPTSKSSSFIYEADVPGILARLRFPRCVMHISGTYPPPLPSDGDEPDDGKAGGSPPESLQEKLIMALLQHGRLRTAQLLHILSPKTDSDQPPPAFQKEVEDALAELVKDRYVERAPHCRLPLPAILRPPKGNAKTLSKLDPETVKEMDAKRKALYREAVRRFRLPAGLGQPLCDSQQPLHTPSRMEDGGSSGKGRPKKKAKLSKGRSAAFLGSQEDDFEDDEEADTILWRANRQHFCRVFLEEDMVECLCKLRGKRVALLVQAILQAGRRDPYMDQISPAVGEWDIQQAVRLLRDPEDDSALQPTEVVTMIRTVLEEGRKPNLLFQFPEGMVGVDTRGILDFMRMQHVTSIIRARFSPNAERLFKLVAEEKQMEMGRLHQQAVMETKHLCPLTHDLLLAGFLSIQDLPKTADHSPMNTFYTLRVDLPGVLKRIGTGILQSILNLRLRLSHEMRQQEQVLQAVENRELITLVTADHKKALERLKLVTRILQTGMLALEPTLLLFNGF
eukprot:jgi/Botrbrau1/8592/Bobra.0380s0013.1